ncbi:MAG: glycosyltransferase family 2 protein [Candidatus Omnitrophica bacterium]|nr:glycosyltransferase family 2 protein [Candidatus Omnitrophota bacterium]
MNSPSVSVGFPVYNEEETIGGVLREAHELLSNSGLDYEILVYDDGSTDRSLSIIEESAGRFPHLRVIHSPHNLGIRTAFERLYSEAKKDLVFINSADRQWKTEILFDMLPLIKDADIVIASRKKKPYGPLREFISWCFNAVPYIIFGVQTYDAGAVKLVKREVLKSFALVSKSPFLEAERLIRAAKAGCRIINYPVEVSPRRTGSSHGVKPKVLLSAFLDVFRVWYSVHFKKDDK